MDREQRDEASRRWIQAASQTPEAQALVALGWQVVSPYGYSHVAFDDAGAGTTATTTFYQRYYPSGTQQTQLATAQYWPKIDFSRLAIQTYSTSICHGHEADP